MLIDHYGYVYRITKNRYFQLLEQIWRDEPFNLVELGAKPLGNCINITSITPEEAKDMLDAMKENA